MTDYIRAAVSANLPLYAREKAREAIQLTGRALPCTVQSVNGAIVTVNFEVNAAPITLPSVTMPVATWVSMQAPIVVGTHGYAASADAYLGGMSGLGGGTADLSERGNLATLVFVPLSNKSWARRDANAVELTGAGSSGLNAQDGTSATKMILNSGGVSISNGGMLAVFSSSGLAITGGTISVNGTVITVP